jgi:hypothetical protein
MSVFTNNADMVRWTCQATKGTNVVGKATTSWGVAAIKIKRKVSKTTSTGGPGPTDLYPVPSQQTAKARKSLKVVKGTNGPPVLSGRVIRKL